MTYYSRPEPASFVRQRRPEPADFAGLTATVFFKSDLKFDREGNATITMLVPWEYRQVAMQLMEATEYPMMITVTPEPTSDNIPDALDWD